MLPLAGQPIGLDFVLAPGGVIRGKVIERDTGTPLPNALVELRDAHAGYLIAHVRRSLSIRLSADS